MSDSSNSEYLTGKRVVFGILSETPKVNIFTFWI